MRKAYRRFCRTCRLQLDKDEHRYCDGCRSALERKRRLNVVTCPECKGEGVSRGYACPGFKPVEIPCLRCQGTKTVPEEMLQWIKNGMAIAKKRRDAKITLRDEAKRLGIQTSQLSDMEMGMVKND